MDLSDWFNRRFVRHYNVSGLHGEDITHSEDGGFFAYTVKFKIIKAELPKEREPRNLEDGCLDVLIWAPKGEEVIFDDYITKLQNDSFWRNSDLALLRKQRKKYASCLENCRLEKTGEGVYHFRARIKTKNEDDVFFAASNFAIKPLFWPYCNRKH